MDEKPVITPRHYPEFPVRVCKVQPNAEYPFRDEEKYSSVEMNLNLTSRTNNRISDDVNALNDFELDLRMIAPPNHHIIIYGNDALLNSGYFLPHPILVGSQPSDPITVKLMKFSEGNDLELPFKGLYCILHENRILRVSGVNSIETSGLYGDLQMGPPTTTATSNNKPVARKQQQKQSGSTRLI